MGDTMWKVTERAVASLLNSERNKRGRDFSESMPDVVSSFYDIWDTQDEDLGYSCISVECKYRKDQPFIRAYSENHMTLIDGFLFFKLELFLAPELLKNALNNCLITVEKKLPKYLRDYYIQSQDYDPYNGEGPEGIDPFPLVVLRMKRDSTLFAYTEKTHIDNILDKIS